VQKFASDLYGVKETLLYCDYGGDKPLSVPLSRVPRGCKRVSTSYWHAIPGACTCSVRIANVAT